MSELIITAADVAEFRAQAEAELEDVCRITIPGEGVKGDFNEETGQYDTVPARVEVYGPNTAPHFGKCRFQIKADINSNVVETEPQTQIVSTYTTSQLQLPVSDVAIPVDATVESISAPYNPALPGRVFNVQGEIGHKSKPVIRRLRLREVVS